MSSDKEAFEERLRRISQSRAQAFATVDAGPGQMRHPKPKSSSIRLWVIMSLVICLLGVGTATLVAAKIYLEPLAMWREVTANLHGEIVAPAKPGVIDKLAAMVMPPITETTPDPIDFFPAAPDGWIRVMPEDAAQPNALDALKARWPQGSDVLPVEKSLGFKKLEWYMFFYEEPDTESKIGFHRAAEAMYLNGNGEFLFVQLRFELEHQPLGGQNDPASWIEGLAAIEAKSLNSGQVLERLQLGGINVTNQTMPAGKSPVSRPIGSDIDATNGIDLAVPLTSRAVLRVQGVTAPAIAQALITSIDRDALAAGFE